MLYLFMSMALMSTASLDINAGNWWAVNDGVMGGVSSGGIKTDGKGVIFTGALSLDNNGGFSSVRKRVEVDVRDATAVRFKVLGDGREYQFRIRHSGRLNRIAWHKPFVTNGTWQEIEVPLEEFVPVWRGRPVDDAGPVVASRIREVGFMLADKNEGQFALRIGSIEFLTSRMREIQ